MKEKLNWYHIAILIYMIELDTTAFSLPRVLAENIGTNGWAAIIPLTVVASLNLLLYAWLYRVGGGKSAFQIVQSVFPRALLIPGYVALGVFWMFLSSLIGKNFILISQMFALYSTNGMLIFLLYCAMVYFLLIKGLYSIVKATTVFFLLSFWMNILIPYFAKYWSAIRLTPFIFQGAEHAHTLHGWAESYMVFVGYELCLFLFPYTDRKSKLFKGVFIGQWLISIVYMFVGLVSYGFFSFQEVQELQFPLITSLQYLEFPFLNRPENLVFTFFLYSNLVSSVLFAFAALSTLKQVFPKAKAKKMEGALAVGIYLCGFASKTLLQSETLIRHTYFIEMGIAFAMPAMLIPVAYYAKRRGARKRA